MGKDFENPFGITLKSGKKRMMSSLVDAGVFPGNQGGPLEHVIAAKAVAFGEALSGVFPGNQGGPLEHVIAAKAVAFGEALSDDYLHYIVRVRNNAQAMAKALVDRGYHIISGGTDNHMMLVDLRSKDISGKDAEIALVKAEITANKNMVPFAVRMPK